MVWCVCVCVCVFCKSRLLNMSTVNIPRTLPSDYSNSPKMLLRGFLFLRHGDVTSVEYNTAAAAMIIIIIIIILW